LLKHKALQFPFIIHTSPLSQRLSLLPNGCILFALSDTFNNISTAKSAHRYRNNSVLENADEYYTGTDWHSNFLLVCLSQVNTNHPYFRATCWQPDTSIIAIAK